MKNRKNDEYVDAVGRHTQYSEVEMSTGVVLNENSPRADRTPDS